VGDYPFRQSRSGGMGTSRESGHWWGHFAHSRRELAGGDDRERQERGLPPRSSRPPGGISILHSIILEHRTRTSHTQTGAAREHLGLAGALDEGLRSRHGHADFKMKSYEGARGRAGFSWTASSWGTAPWSSSAFATWRDTHRRSSKWPLAHEDLRSNAW